MFASLRIARVFGINLYIHWTFWLLPLWIVFFGHDTDAISLPMHLLLVAALFLCIVLHEFGHALTARHFGIRTRSITLSPLGGVAQLERMSQKPWEEFCIAIAGPMVNVAIAALLGFGLVNALIFDRQLLETGPGLFAGLLFLMNIGMIVFNMIPAFPMDGGRVLRAMLAAGLGLLPATRVAIVVGAVCAGVFAVGGMLWLHNPWLVLIALFVIWAGYQELRALEAQEQARLAEEEEIVPAVLAPAAQTVPVTPRVTICIWDPERHVWVHRSYGD